MIAYEIEPDIAARAAANLARYPQVEVRARSGVEDLPQADAIYVNAAASHPLRAWLDALKVGGRLVFPLQAARSSGAMLMVTRPERGEAWPARLLSGVVFIPCEGAQDPRWAASSTRRSAAAAQERVRSLRLGGAPSHTRLGPRRRLGVVDRAGRVGLALMAASSGCNFRASAVQGNASKSKEKSLNFLGFAFGRNGAFQRVTAKSK